MYIYQCGKIDHPAGQVYSVDLHPNGAFLATAGFDGRGKGLLVIWNLAQITGDTHQVDDGRKFKIEMDKKDYPERQNCVRWSRHDHGKYLVVVGDSHIIYMYQPYINYQTSKFELNDSIKLVGHKSEVLHADFSRCGKYMASCSLDTSVLIWEMANLSRPVMVLNDERNGHTDKVRGLAWDPLERFLATQSCDQTIKVWKVGSWECEKTIKGFGNLSKFYSRLDWTSDGSMLVVPSCSNNGFSTTKLLLRKEWFPKMDLVGFQGPTSCVRSSTRCTYYFHEKSNTKKVVSLVAIGSQDRSVSIWLLPGATRPLCVIQNILREEILDLAWYSDTLVVCGLNGSVRCVKLEKNDIGELLNNQEMTQHFQSIYSYVPSIYRDKNVGGGIRIGMKPAKEVYDEFPEPSDEMAEYCKKFHYFFQPHEPTRECSQCRKKILENKARFKIDSSPVKNIIEIV